MTIKTTGEKRLALVSGRAHQGLAEEVAALLGTTLVPTTAYDFAKKNDHDSTASLLEETSNTNRSNTSRYNTYRARGGKRRTRKNKRGSRKH